MRAVFLSGLTAVVLVACAPAPSVGPAGEYTEVSATTILDAPSADIRNAQPKRREMLRRGEYMVELLGCGTCHTNGALLGEPDYTQSLAGSDIGIAYTSPLDERLPGIVFAPNLTPDTETGIGRWSEEMLIAAIRQGKGRHGNAASRVMPWPGYAKLTDEDSAAIAHYLMSLDPIRHKVPDNVAPGQRTKERYIHFGFYQKS